MNDDDIKKLEADVWQYVLTLKDSPAARLESRYAFYARYGQETSTEKFGFGDAEIAFFGWEERAVLRPPNANPPGSPWWSSVNLWFIYLSELGSKAYESGIDASRLPVAAQCWVTFIKTPNAANWYRAHNASIIDGYLKYTALAVQESLPEKIFINMVLYRLLYAQSMVEGEFMFPRLGKILGNPRGSAVEFITSFDAYYPDHYPMTQAEINELMGNTHNLGELGVEVLDDVLVEPELTQLYAAAANWNQQPLLNTLLVQHRPAYPDGKPLPNTHHGCLIGALVWLRNIIFKK